MDAEGRRSRRPTGGLVGVMGIVLALLVWGAILWSRSNANPSVTVPTPAMPSPNAYDDVKAAAAALAKTKLNDAWITVSSNTWMRNGEYSHLYTPTERAVLLAANAEALRRLRQGLTREYRHPPRRSFDNGSQEKFYPGCESLTRLLILDSEEKAARQDWPGATNAALDAVRLGEDLPRGETYIGMVFGVLPRRHGLKQLAALAPHLSARQSREAAQRLSDILPRHVPYAEVLQEEKWATQASLLQLFQSRDSARRIRTELDPAMFANKQTPLQRLGDLTRLYFPDRRKVMKDYTNYMDQVIANAQLPASTAPPPPPKPDDSLITNLLWFLDGNSRSRDLRAETTGAQTELALALRAYRLEHGRYPNQLSALVPTYLKRLPDDPRAAPGTSFGYRRVAANYSLLSADPTEPQEKALIAKFEGKSAPDFSAPDRSGKSVSLSSLRGKAVVVEFWASWCAPCREVMPILQEIHTRLSGKGVVVLAIDAWDARADGETFLQKNPQYTFPALMDPAETNGSESIATRLYGVQGIPTTIFIDKAGVVRKYAIDVHPRQFYWDALKQLGVDAAAR